MDTFNEVIPYNLDMQWVKNDTFTFLGNKITVWLSKECGEGLDVSAYDGTLTVKYRKQDSTLETITTASGEMIFTDNVITFNKPDLSLKVGDYFYQLKLIDKVDTSIVGTLFEGTFKVKN
jgi:hypothetical protein